MNIGKLIMSGVGVVVGTIMLVIGDTIVASQTFNQTLTTTVMQYVPTLFGVGILIGSIAWAFGALKG